MIRINSLGFAYGDQPVFEDFSAQLDGRCCIMAPSGRGKTTLLRLIAGLELPHSGTIESDFERAAILFQEDRLLPWFSALKNVEAALPHAQRARAAELLEAVGLSESIKKRPDELSGGMCRRLALARTLACGGDILLLDEPFKGADTDTARMLARLLLAQELPMVVLTHDEREAEMLDAWVLRI